MRMNFTRFTRTLVFGAFSTLASPNSGFVNAMDPDVLPSKDLSACLADLKNIVLEKNFEAMNAFQNVTNALAVIFRGEYRPPNYSDIIKLVELAEEVEMRSSDVFRLFELFCRDEEVVNKLFSAVRVGNLTPSDVIELFAKALRKQTNSEKARLK